EDALEYLFTKYDIRKIGMLGGPEDNSDASERKATYLEFLKKHNIEFKENWFVAGNLTQRCKKEAAELLSGFPDAEAIFCVNDLTAIALYEEMRKRGLEPGIDIRVFGFDNEVVGSMMNPSLSTIDASTFELGGHAYKMLSRMMKGEKVDNETVPTRFICRDSFGSVVDVIDHSGEQLLNKKKVKSYFDQVFYRYRYGEITDSSNLRISFLLLMEELIDIVNNKEKDTARIRRLKDNFRQFFKNGAMKYTDYDELIPYLERLQGEILKRLNDFNSKQYVYDFMGDILKQIIKVQNNNIVKHDDDMDQMLYSMKTLVRDSLNFSYANDLSYLELVAHLDWMNIKNAYVYIFERPVVHLQYETFNTPQVINLKAVLKDGVPESVPFNKQKVLIENIFENDEINFDRYNMVMMPLFFGDTVFGIIIYDLTEMTLKNGEFLANLLGTAARVIHILKVNNEVQKELEDNIAIMRQHNIELDKLSRNDVLTGILNRRGFKDTAPEVIHQNITKGNDSLFLYIDMNNLKIINDRFGHEEGDFSLKTISSILTDIIKNDGIVGRIGGDEYAMVYFGEMDQNTLSHKIKESFENFNAASDKPYNISVSCGFCKIKKDAKWFTLEEAMSIADRDLYIAKQNKDNRIIK
nr:GGDEF domain-containing protein [Eubacterium sp.]